MSWKTIYSDTNIKKWGLPASASLDNQGIVRGLVLTWTEMEQNFRKLNPAPDPSDNIWYVVCDVLILDDNPRINDQLYIFARRIEIQTDIAFLISSSATSATIVTQEIIKNNKPATLQASFMSANEADEPKNVTLKPYADRAATIFTLKTPSTLETNVWTPSRSIVSHFGDNLANGETLRLVMVTTFQVASLLASSTNSDISTALAAIKTTPSELAINQLEWVAAITDVSIDTRVIAGQARTQLSWVVKRNQGLVFVPPLDFSVYRDAVEAQVKVLKARSAAYDKWVDMERSNDNWLAQTKLTVALQANETELQTQLEKRAESKLHIAKDAETEAAAQLKALETALVQANVDFEAGVKTWKSKNKRSAAFTLILDTVKFGVAIGKLVAMVAAPGAGEVAGAAEVGGAASAAGAGEVGGAAGAVGKAAGAGKASAASKSVTSQLKTVKDLLGPVGEAAGDGVAIEGDINKIIEIGKTADAMNTMADDTLTKVNSALDQTFTISPLKGLDTVTGGKHVWESLQVKIDDLFDRDKNLLNDIDKGPEFRVAFRQLVIGAEAYCSSRLAVAEAANSLAEAKLRMNAAKKSVDLAENTQKEFEDNDALYEQLQQDTFGRLLDAKRAVYLQLEQYQQASYYFTLSNAQPPLPKITASVDDFIEKSAAISGLELVLNELTPTPQNLHSLPISLPINNNQRVDKAIVVHIDVTNKTFKQYARIRIDKIEIALLDKNDDQILVNDIKIGTSGTYNDIIPTGGTAQFSGNPFICTVTYDSKGTVELDSEVYARFGDAVFKPTPFTTWRFQLPDVETVNKVSTLQLTITGAASSRNNDIVRPEPEHGSVKKSMSLV